jgi:uncharacterized protein
MLEFDGFDWDHGNLEKCTRHGLSLSEIEVAFEGNPKVAPDIGHSGEEVRMIAIGRSNISNKPIFVAFTLREIDGLTYIRPISARPMHAKEIARYER